MAVPHPQERSNDSLDSVAEHFYRREIDVWRTRARFAEGVIALLMVIITAGYVASFTPASILGAAVIALASVGLGYFAFADRRRRQR